MSNYFYAKLCSINYSVSIHEGNASRRLASESIRIMLQLLPSECPDKYRNNLVELRELISDYLKGRSTKGLIPSKIGNMQNKKAVKYIKLLIDIENHIRLTIED